jgi:hypothetical protein
MGKYSSLAKRIEEENPQERGNTTTSNILNVNIDNIHSIRETNVDKPTSAIPKDTLQPPPPVESSQDGASGSEITVREAYKRPTTLRPTTLTTLFEDGEVTEGVEEVWRVVPRDPHRYTNLARRGASTRCIHGTTFDKCAVCSGYVRWLVGDEDRLRRAQANPETVRREFWRAVRGGV